VFYFVLAGAPEGKWNDLSAISNLYGGGGHFPLTQVFVTEVVFMALKP
jgi:hypothetical protein